MPGGTPEQDIEPEETEEQRLLSLAWGIIANAGQGDWTREGHEWIDAATRWRDQYHRYLSLTR